MHSHTQTFIYECSRTLHSVYNNLKYQKTLLSFGRKIGCSSPGIHSLMLVFVSLTLFHQRKKDKDRAPTQQNILLMSQTSLSFYIPNMWLVSEFWIQSYLQTWSLHAGLDHPKVKIIINHNNAFGLHLLTFWFSLIYVHHAKEYSIPILT